MSSERNKVRSRRVDVQHATMLLFADGSEVPVTITDLSDGGFRLTSQELLVVGERVRLRDRRGDMLAEIRWVEGFNAGGRFLTPPAPAN